jgi:hypothetical protein
MSFQVLNAPSDGSTGFSDSGSARLETPSSYSALGYQHTLVDPENSYEDFLRFEESGRDYVVDSLDGRLMPLHKTSVVQASAEHEDLLQFASSFSSGRVAAQEAPSVNDSAYTARIPYEDAKSEFQLCRDEPKPFTNSLTLQHFGLIVSLRSSQGFRHTYQNRCHTGA